MPTSQPRALTYRPRPISEFYTPDAPDTIDTGPNVGALPTTTISPYTIDEFYAPDTPDAIDRGPIIGAVASIIFQSLESALAGAIFARLTGIEDMTKNPLAARAIAAQSQLAALLTISVDDGSRLTITDPLTGISRDRTPADAVRLGSKGQSVIFPEVTFRPSAGVVDERFSDQTFAVDHPIYDFETWDNSFSGTLMSDVQACLLDLLDCRRGAPPLPIDPTLGKCYWGETMVTGQNWPDQNWKSWFTLWRCRFIVAR